MKKLFLLTIILSLIFSNIKAFVSNPINKRDKTESKAIEALSFCRESHYNTEFCVLIDMSVHSGKVRFFVWDFNKDTVALSGLVSHGRCGNSTRYDKTKDKPGFSNTVNSFCTSLGKYRIGERANSEWGINVKYVLYGIDTSNFNAFKRNIVMHSYEEIPDSEVYPEGTPEGRGCPCVSNKVMRKVDEILKTSSKPVLLWIYK